LDRYKEGGVKIEILGTGCPKCEQLAQNAKTAIEELGFTAEVSKVTDIVEIANRGVMMTPALSVDGDIKLVGKVATVEELKAIFTS
jgi:small redox-active disulfide protein 2